jgi:predicted phage terminase large subunit-like protein
MGSEEAEILAVHKVLCTSSLENFTRYFFMRNQKRKFVFSSHHKAICEALDKVVKGEITRLIINLPPRYSKTELAVKHFIAYALALNPSAKFIHISYSADLALDNSEAIKDIVKSDPFREMFPNVRIKQGTDSKGKWLTTEGGTLYATSSAGQLTGFGAGQIGDVVDEEEENFDIGDSTPEKFGGALIIDDPIKPEDADSPLLRDKVNKRFDSTIRNRVNARSTPIILIGQRLHEDDLTGYLLRNEPGEWTVLSLPAIVDHGTENATALWPFKHDLPELLKMETLNPTVFARQYLQRADSVTGRLYKSFRTYKELPLQMPVIKAVVDAADLGTDMLVSIVFAAKVDGFYILDVYYSQEGAEITESRVARQMQSHQVQEVRIESNGGGRSFARNVERISRESGNFRTRFTPYTQSKNKYSRIFSQSAEVQNMVFYPENWERRWPLFANDVKSYQSDGSSRHDDAPDALTMIIEAQRLGNYKVIYTNGNDTYDSAIEGPFVPYLKKGEIERA